MSQTNGQLFGFDEVLEIVKAERDCLRGEVTRLKDELVRMSLRAERAEERLYEITLAMADARREAVVAPIYSNTTEVTMDDKDFLRLDNPVAFGKQVF